ncbi:MAGUK p55 subfamily member 6-like isoform X1 [Pomacea canaliculata]|uniref:MAGUK p55 subfamily member 6-like isoform X1 n=2 Tax=Pomacea canaliculata TaxID=400727 RepID=UPI000D735A1E|nr:MAGUK p55 subfamily member 6-like isoform X1 [Pomacea canaliculata]
MYFSIKGFCEELKQGEGTMPSATSEALSAKEAVEQLRENLDDLEHIGAENDDIEFLRQILEDHSLMNIIDIHENLEVKLPRARDHEAVETARDVLDLCGVQANRIPAAADLRNVMDSPHFKALLIAHDDICNKRYEEQFETYILSEPPPPVFSTAAEQVRFVNIHKSQNEPLGITVKLDEKDDLVIARILQGSLIDKQGLLHVNDIVREVNGIPVCTPEQLMEVIMDSDPSITFKVVPSYHNKVDAKPLYMRARFNYDPMKDRLLPCKETGLPFQLGDVLEIVNRDDQNWWQARLADINGPVGLIPSPTLEEKRKAFVPVNNDYSKSSLFCGLTKKKKKTIKYSSKDSKEFDTADVQCYEEVRRMAPFQRRVLVLVGAHGVGRRSLKERLIKDDPRRFGAAMPHTSRAPREKEVHGQGYYFTDRLTMEADIMAGKYVEYGEFNNNLYGTRLDTVREVIDSGKMCVLDVNPTALKVLKTSEFLPFIVFIAAPSVEALKVMYEEGRRFARGNKDRGGVEMKTEEDFITTVKESQQIERVYSSYFDDIIVNDSFEDAYRQLRKALNELTSEQQWVPVNWVY